MAAIRSAHPVTAAIGNVCSVWATRIAHQGNYANWQILLLTTINCVLHPQLMERCALTTMSVLATTAAIISAARRLRGLSKRPPLHVRSVLQFQDGTWDVMRRCGKRWCRMLSWTYVRKWPLHWWPLQPVHCRRWLPCFEVLRCTRFVLWMLGAKGSRRSLQQGQRMS